MMNNYLDLSQHSYLPDTCLLSYHSFRVESGQFLQQLFALQLSLALMVVQSRVPELLQHLAQFLGDLLATLTSLLQLYTQTFLLAPGFVER